MLSFTRDSRGRLGRLNVEHSVQLISVQTVKMVQAQLIDSGLPLMPREPSRLYVTILHIGRPDELLYEIRDCLESTNHKKLPMWQLYMALQPVFTAALSTNLQTISVAAGPVRPYGTGYEPALALTLTPSPDWLNRRSPIIKVLEEALRQCGVDDPEVFMAQSKNLSYTPNFNPHLTVGRIPHNTPLPDEIDVPECEIVLGPIRITGTVEQRS